MSQRDKPRRIYDGPESIVVLDERRRCTLGKIGRPEHRLYGVEQHDDGTITLTPLVPVPAAEVEAMNETIAILSDDETMAALDDAEAEAMPAVRAEDQPWLLTDDEAEALGIAETREAISGPRVGPWCGVAGMTRADV